MAAWKECVFVLLISLSFSRQAVYYFVSRSPCPQEEQGVCRTLEDFVSDATMYFRSNTTFAFEGNKHYLTVSLDLANLTNVMFKGNVGTEIIVSPSAGFFFSYASDITFQSMCIINTGEENDVSNVALSFKYTSFVFLSTIKFEHVNHGKSRSRSIEILYSSAEVTNCSFYDGFLIKGGAISACGSNISFYGETHFENNTADFSGGAIHANNSVLMFKGNTYFRRNKAGTVYYPSDFNIGGGGIFAWRSAVDFSGYTEFTDNRPIHYYDNVLIGAAILAIQDSTITIQGTSVFCNNSGYNGGALFLVDTVCYLSGVSTYRNNTATVRSGGAIFAYRSTLSANGAVQVSDNFAMERGGGIYLEQSTLHGEGEVNFTQNVVSLYGGGAIALLNSILELSGVIDFVSNQGYNGGALELLGGTSQIGLNSPVSVSFERNRARTGGAILVVDSLSTYATQCQNLSIERMNCFYKVQTPDHSLEDIRLKFTENFVNYSGASIYGGTLELCRVQVNGNQSFMNGYEFLQNMSVVTHLPNVSSDISSKPLKVCRCNNGVPMCSSTDIFVNKTIVPGRTFNIEVMAVGQLSMPEAANIVNIFSSTNGSAIQPQPYNSILVSRCHNIGYKIFTRNTVEKLQIYPEGCNSYNASLFLTLTVDQCPPGFQLMSGLCRCENRLMELAQDESLCDIQTGLIRRPGTNWIQPVLINGSYAGYYSSRNCRRPYCLNYNSSSPTWMNFSSQEDDVLCQPNRTGLSCRSCKEKYSLVMRSLTCELCDDKFLSLILFFMVAGIALICILLLLQMTVSKGTLYGLIFYCNFVNICSGVFFPRGVATVTPLSLFIAWINFDLGIPTCFYDGLDAYAYIWFQFAFPFYLWFLIIAIIIASRFSSKVGRMLGSNPVGVLATVVLLSFTKLLETTVYALSYHIVYRPDGTIDLRWRSDTSLPFFGQKHIFLAIFSIIVIVAFLVPYIFLITFGYRLLKFSGNKGFLWFNNFKPLLDAYYAPFSHRGRYWLGLTLFLRSSLFITFIVPVFSVSNGTLIVATSLFASLITLGWIGGPIYENKYLEMLEASFILNTCIIAVASYHVRSIKGNQLYVTYTSVAIAFLEFIGIVIFHIFQRIVTTNCLKRYLSQRLQSSHDKDMKGLARRGTTSQIERSGRMVNTNQFTEIRESLLDDVISL